MIKKCVLFLLLSLSFASIETIPLDWGSAAGGNAGVAMMANPASLVQDFAGVTGRFETSRWWMDTTLQQAEIRNADKKGWSWGLSWARLGDDQGIEWTGTTGTSNGTLYYGETQLAFSAAYPFGPDNWGISLRNMSQQALGNRTFVALDLGWQRAWSSWLRTGIAVKNIAGTFTSAEASRYAEGGVVLTVAPFDMAVDYSTRVANWRWGLGWECEGLALRGGLDEDQMLSAGCSLAMTPIRIDYAWKSLTGLGTLHRIALEVTW